MAFQFTQTGAQIQDILDDYGTPVTLFSGYTDGDITLAQDASLFSKIEILYEGFNGAYPSSTKIKNPDGKMIALSIVEPGGNPTATRIRRSRYSISGTAMTIDAASSGYVMIENNGTTHTLGAGVIRITEVIGYF